MPHLFDDCEMQTFAEVSFPCLLPLLARGYERLELWPAPKSRLARRHGNIILARSRSSLLGRQKTSLDSRFSCKNILFHSLSNIQVPWIAYS